MYDLLDSLLFQLLIIYGGLTIVVSIVALSVYWRMRIARWFTPRARGARPCTLAQIEWRLRSSGRRALKWARFCSGDTEPIVCAFDWNGLSVLYLERDHQTSVIDIFAPTGLGYTIECKRGRIFCFEHGSSRGVMTFPDAHIARRIHLLVQGAIPVVRSAA